MISAKRNYDMGLPIGQFATYHPLGHKLTEGTMKGLDEYGNMVKDGKWLFWGDDGLLKEVYNGSTKQQVHEVNWQQILNKESVANFNQWVQKMLNHEYLNVEYSDQESKNYPLLRRFQHMEKFDIGLCTQMFLDYLLLKLD